MGLWDYLILTAATHTRSQPTARLQLGTVTRLAASAVSTVTSDLLSLLSLASFVWAASNKIFQAHNLSFYPLSEQK